MSLWNLFLIAKQLFFQPGNLAIVDYSWLFSLEMSEICCPMRWGVLWSYSFRQLFRRVLNLFSGPYVFKWIRNDLDLFMSMLWIRWAVLYFSCCCFELVWMPFCRFSFWLFFATALYVENYLMVFEVEIVLIVSSTKPARTNARLVRQILWLTWWGKNPFQILHRIGKAKSAKSAKITQLSPNMIFGEWIQLPKIDSRFDFAKMTLPVAEGYYFFFGNFNTNNIYILLPWHSFEFFYF